MKKHQFCLLEKKQKQLQQQQQQKICLFFVIFFLNMIQPAMAVSYIVSILPLANVLFGALL